MRKLWSDEEKTIARKMKADNELYRNIAKVLTENGHNRTIKAIERFLDRDKNNYEIDIKTEHVKFDGPKILVFDIETAGFHADMSEIYMMGYRWFHEPKPKIIRFWDFEGWEKLDVEKKDLYLIKEISSLIAEADVLVGHYSKKFDHAYIQTRCLIHKLPPIPKTLHIDTWALARFQLKMGGNSMKNIANAFNCKDRKDSVPKYIWRRAQCNNMEALEFISDYCLQDIRTQYEMTKRLMPIVVTMPCWNIFDDGMIAKCPSCGSDNIKRYGSVYTKVNRYARYQCQECGKWLRGRRTKTHKDIYRLTY